MNEELRKNLAALIDETIAEIDELKKSRFSAAEIEIKGPGEGIAGKPSDGKLDAAKAEDEKEEDEDEEEEAEKAEDSDEDEDEDEDEAEKSDSTSDPADSEASKRKLKSLLGKADKDDKKDDKDEPHKDDPKHEDKEKKMAQKLLDMHKSEMKKSLDESEALFKSVLEQRVQPLEAKLSSIFDLVKQIAEQPVPAKGVSARAIPLMKSTEDAGEPLTKSEIASKLFELKKSGIKVDSADIARAEMGHDLNKIVEKYKIS